MKNEKITEPKWQHGAVFENINGLKWDEVSVDAVPGKDEPAVILNNVSKD
jgi:hypothetical protein